MSSFFDKKEDVLDIVLTPHGRRLLSQGKLMPVYYSFLDDDIMYDSATAGDTESNYQVKSRILSNTPSLKPQTNLTDLQAKLKDENPDLSSDNIKYDLYTIGTSNTKENFAPSWDLKLFENEISSSTKNLSSTLGIKNVPQINVKVEYTISVGNVSNDNDQRGQSVSPELPISKVYLDGTYVKIEEEQILANILEKNGFLHSESLELEVLLYDDTEAENLIPLKFAKRSKLLRDDLLYDDTTRGFDTLTAELTSSQVEYYFDVRVDDEVPIDEAGKLKQFKLKVEGQEPVADEKIIYNSPIYNTDVTPDDIEDCD